MKIFFLYIEYFIYFILSFILFFLVGRILLTLFYRKPVKSLNYTTIFFSVLLGIIVTNIGFATVKTLFKTSQLLFILPLIFFNYEVKKHFPHNTIKTTQTLKIKNVLMIILPAALFIYTLFFFSIIQNDSFPFLLSFKDYIYYANLSYYINISGQENYFHIYNLYEPAYHGVKPYHYFDLWANAFIATLFGKLYVLHYFLNTYPLFYLLVFIGILSFWEAYSKEIKVKEGILSIIFLFIGPLYFNFFQGIPPLKHLDSFLLPLHSHAFKLVQIYIFILSFFLIYKKNLKISAFVSLLFLPVVNVATLPVIYGTIILFLLVNTFKKLYIKTEEIKRLSFYTFSSFIAFFIFYSIFDKSSIGATSIHLIISDFINKNLTISNLKTMFNIVGFIVIALFLIYLPYIIIIISRQLYLNRFTNILKDPFIGFCMFFSLIVLVAGSLAWMLLHQFLDSVQLFYVIVIPVLNCLIIIWLIKNISQRKIKKIELYFIILLCMFNAGVYIKFILNIRGQKTYTTAYLNEINKIINKVLSPANAVFLRGEYKNVYDFNETAFAIGDYLLFLKNGLYPVSISDVDRNFKLCQKGNFLPHEKRIIEKEIKTGLFYQYVTKQKANNEFTSIGESQRRFIEEHHIKFIILPKDVELPKELSDKVIKEIQDSISGERFIVLKGTL